MFEKLLSLIPYNPSLVHQMAFYSRRMREEASIRRIGMIFIVLAFLVQFFAVLAPPIATDADPNNDLLSGGFTSVGEVVTDCNKDLQHYADIMANYGISCADISKGVDTTLVSTAANGSLYSMGRLDYGTTNAASHKPTKQQVVPIPSAGGNYYVRLLDSFDTGASSSYHALAVTSSITHKGFWILFGCGNLASILPPVPYVKPAPPAPAPTPTPTPVPTPHPTPVCAYDTNILSTDSQCVACQYNTAIIANDVTCKPCTESINSEDLLACVKESKSATNVTQSVANADGTTAQPGDVITYTLKVVNNGKADIKDFQFEDNISDILDYADVSDLHGGSIASDNTVSWPAFDLAAGATATQTFTIKVKAVIPQTPASPTDPQGFDLIMTNVYGNAINIHVPGSPAKTIEVASTTLVNTGPGTSIFIAAAIMVLGGYFYSRSRLLAKESALVLQDTAGA